MSPSCASGQCGCASAEATAPTPSGLPDIDFGPTDLSSTDIARINGVALHPPGQRPDEQALRQRACSELLRQAAQAAGLLDTSDAAGDDGALTEAASEAIERLLERQLVLPEPSEQACRRFHAANAARYTTGERVRARHVLFAVVPGVDVAALRQRAEKVLLDLRCHGADVALADAAFARAAQELSNCPSGAQGGELGWLTRTDCAPEFAVELFGHLDVGVLPRLVHSRFGLHVVQVLEREAGLAQPWESVQSAVRLALQQQTYITALRQYLSLLAAQAELVGVELEAADSPLVQ